VPGLTLASVVTGNPERAAQVREHYPGASVLATADELFADPHDLAVIAAPNRHHAALALGAIEAGMHVVIDKPLAPSVTEAERVASAAARAGVVASVFHNRRWDGDYLTLRRLLEDGAVGELVRLESRFERWRPEVDFGKWREGGGPEDAGGVLFDLGPHLIDQALELLGPARSVYAEVRNVRTGVEVDDDVFVALEHESGARSHLWATMVAAQPAPRFRALGSRAAYVKRGVDPQEDALRAGGGPRDPGFGAEPREAWGLLGHEDSAAPVATEPGRYVEYYEGIERAIRGDGPTPVPLAAGIETLRVIEAARASSAERAVVQL